MNYNYNPELTKRILKYKNFRLFPGGRRGEHFRIRWLLEDKNGTSVYCDRCGNIANACLYEVHGRHLLTVPICKRHGQELLEADSDYVAADLIIYKQSEADLINLLMKEKEAQRGEKTIAG